MRIDDPRVPAILFASAAPHARLYTRFTHTSQGGRSLAPQSRPEPCPGNAVSWRQDAPSSPASHNPAPRYPRPFRAFTGHSGAIPGQVIPHPPNHVVSLTHIRTRIRIRRAAAMPTFWHSPRKCSSYTRTRTIQDSMYVHVYVSHRISYSPPTGASTQTLCT